ncbi:MAG: hypothetical protein KGM43_02750 [Planctomycetota bacterium]|nr:hypothetical protein [Planctomycetota bacterium]
MLFEHFQEVETTVMGSRRTWARFMQLLGLLILPFAVVSELVAAVGLGKSLLISAGGMLLFYTGYQLQHRE